MAYVIIDGTLISIDRIAADRPFCSGKHHVHGMNPQVIASPGGTIRWVWRAAAGQPAGHRGRADLEHPRRAARRRAHRRGRPGLPRPRRNRRTGHHPGTKGRNKPESQKDANRAHARLRGPGERVNAQLKHGRILRKLRCCPRRAGRLATAIHGLQNHELTAG